MLIRPFYLKTDALNDYVATIENGLRETEVTKRSSTASKGASVDLRFADADFGGGNSTESTRAIRDHDTSKLERLILFGRSNAEEASWVEVLDPQTQLAEIRTGEMLEWECDVYTPEISSYLSNREGLSDKLNLMADLVPYASHFGKSTPDIPDPEQLRTFAKLLEGLDLRPVLIGEDDDTDWRVVGTLDPESIRIDEDFDDRARVIAKVKKSVEADSWFPLMAIPGMPNNREVRRELARRGPTSSEDEKQFLRGPLVLVDFLAIYI